MKAGSEENIPRASENCSVVGLKQYQLVYGSLKTKGEKGRTFIMFYLLWKRKPLSSPSINTCILPWNDDEAQRKVSCMAMVACSVASQLTDLRYLRDIAPSPIPCQPIEGQQNVNRTSKSTEHMLHAMGEWQVGPIEVCKTFSCLPGLQLDFTGPIPVCLFFCWHKSKEAQRMVQGREREYDFGEHCWCQDPPAPAPVCPNERSITYPKYLLFSWTTPIANLTAPEECLEANRSRGGISG